MSWVAIIQAILGLAVSLIGYLQSRKSLDAASAREIADSLRRTIDAIETAQRARDSVSDDPADIVRDPDNRDAR